MSDYNPYDKIRKVEINGIKDYEVDGMYFGNLGAAQRHVREGRRHDVVMRRVGDSYVVDSMMFESRHEAEAYAHELVMTLRSIHEVNGGWAIAHWNEVFRTRDEAEYHVRRHFHNRELARQSAHRNKMHEAFTQGRRDGECIIEQVVKEHEAMKVAQEAVVEKKAKKKPAKPEKRDRYAAIRV